MKPRSLLLSLLLALAVFAPPAFGQSSPVVQIGCASARVNCLQISGATTGNSPLLEAIGPDANINIRINAKGTGSVIFNAAAFNATLNATGTANAQPISGDLNLSGLLIGHTGGYLIGAMGNVLFPAGTTAAGNNASTTAGVLGKYTGGGTVYTPGYPRAGVVGEAAGFVTDAAVMGVATDGDFPGLTVRSIFGVDNQVGPGATIKWGIDLKGIAHDVYAAIAYSVGEIQFSLTGGVVTLTSAITANVTSCSAFGAQYIGLTSNGTGGTTIWLCDGTKWQKSV